MLLAIDTATRWVGLALHDGNAVVAEHGWRCGNTHTIELTPAVAEMLERAGITAADLKGIAVAIGPGSYTGLRVGLSLAKGLALANQVPLAAVPTLDIVAASVGPVAERLLVAVAAGRGRVCAATYEWQRTRWQVTSGPVIETWDNLLPTLPDGTMLFAGEITAAAASVIRSTNKNYRVAVPASSVRRAGFLAELGWARLRQGPDDARTLAPLYLRDPAGN